MGSNAHEHTMQYVHVHAHLCDTLVCADFVGLMLFTIKFNWTPQKISRYIEFMYMYMHMNKAWYLSAHNEAPVI